MISLISGGLILVMLVVLGLVLYRYPAHVIIVAPGMIGVLGGLQLWTSGINLAVSVYLDDIVSPSVSATEWDHFRNPTVLIPNRFDTYRFRPPSAAERHVVKMRLSIAPDQFAIVTIGNCAPAKNHGMLLEALSKVAARGIQFVYFHIGLEEQSMAERTLAKILRIDDKVRFLGWIKNPAEYLYAADLYVMCSTHEGFSIAALEAMACGLHLLLTDVPGLRDLRWVAKGIIWTKLTPSSVIDAIESACNMGETERLDLGARMSSSVHQHFCPAAGVSSYAALTDANHCRKQPSSMRSPKEHEDQMSRCEWRSL